MLGRATVAVLFLVLVWGNLVAGLKAGLACPDWPLCHGKILPPLRWDIYMEFMHRVIAAVASLFLVALSIRRLGSYRGAARAVPLLALAVLVLQIGMGGMVVLLRIPVQLTTIHFMTGIFLFLLAFYMMSFDGVAEPPGFSFRGGTALSFSLVAMVFFQAALGAYVRHLQAGQACPDFPKCLGQWVPSSMTPSVMAHYSHRVVGLMVLLTAAAIHLLYRKDPARRGSQGLADLFLALVAGQIALGGLVVLSGLQYGVVALHLAVALSILLVLGRLWIEAVRADRG